MNLGFPEILVLLLAALLIFGPKRLPEIARSLGKALRTFQSEASRAAGDLRGAVEDVGVIDEPDGARSGEASGDPSPGGKPAVDPAHEDT